MMALELLCDGLGSEVSAADGLDGGTLVFPSRAGVGGRPLVSRGHDGGPRKNRKYVAKNERRDSREACVGSFESSMLALSKM